MQENFEKKMVTSNQPLVGGMCSRRILCGSLAPCGPQPTVMLLGDVKCQVSNKIQKR